MGTTHRRTVVRNYGSLNKGGSKVITSFGKNGMSSIRTIRGSVNNKSGGMDNQYTTSTFRPDKDTGFSSKSSTTPTRSNAKSTGDDAAVSMILGIFFIVFLGAFWVTWKGLVWAYEKFFEKSTHMTD